MSFRLAYHQNLHSQLLRHHTTHIRLSNTLRASHTSRRSADETTLASAKHKPSLSGPSLGHLITELSATTPDMLREGVRKEGHTMNEEHRTLARRVAIGTVGLPLALGSVVVGAVWLWPGDAER